MRSPDPRNCKRMRPAVAAQISAARGDELIVMLDRKGWDPGKIGRAAGLSRGGVSMALQRIREGRPGRVRGE
jgi:hypothetical protein